MTAKQRRYERTVIGYLERLERKVNAVCKAAGIDPDTLIDLSMLDAIQDNADGDQGFDATGEELAPTDQVDEVLESLQETASQSAPPEPVAAEAKPPNPTKKGKAN